MSIELPVATRRRRDMTEKLLKSKKISNDQIMIQSDSIVASNVK